MKKGLVLAVGNSLMGDDGAGPLLAGLMKEKPIQGWDVIEGGLVPENMVDLIRDRSPQRVLVVDASDMDLPPGTTCLINDDMLADPFFITTHTLPLTFLIEAIRDFVPEVDLLGIQPDLIAFGYPMSIRVRDAVHRVYHELASGKPAWEPYSRWVEAGRLDQAATNDTGNF